MAGYAGRRSARENDIGRVIDLARVQRIYVHEKAPDWVELQDTRTKTTLFEGTPTAACRFLKGRDGVQQ
ncbi:hypothetical protein KIH07_18570 [Hydrogenophaga taeniospiralis]|uniref:hypothetical protein n=1 Tax=Hydrogenophaga taeniospiralis TaxID=65656 RepID=UPI001CFBA584|nr:hypothetical protein [Hydrogenophaga taeniospiralis]MCB4365745.1 hypothetical protein [Hydrogenophaga taeniospiralis]